METRRTTDADGTWTETVDPKGNVVARALISESAAYAAREKPHRDAAAAARTKADADAAKDTAADAVIAAQVNRIRAIPPASRTDVEKMLMAIAWKLGRLE